MKKIRITALALSLTMAISLLSGCSGSDSGITQEQLDAVQAQLDTAQAQLSEANAKISDLENAPYDGAQFVKWFEEEGTWHSPTSSQGWNGDPTGFPAGFVAGEAAKPTDEDLEAMLHMASLAVTASGNTDYYLVAIRDPEEQMSIIGDKYDGVETYKGTVTVLVYSERLLRNEFRKDGDTNPYLFQPDRGYYNAGIVSGYLNTAAIALGYATHFYMSPNLEGSNGFNDGGLGQDASKYLTAETYGKGDMAGGLTELGTQDMKFVAAIVIGTPDRTLESGVTMNQRPGNYLIWD